MYAGDVSARFDVTRSAISQHLGVLTDVGLVSAEHRGVSGSTASSLRGSHGSRPRSPPSGPTSSMSSSATPASGPARPSPVPGPTTTGEAMNTDVVYTSSVDLPVGPEEAFALVTEPGAAPSLGRRVRHRRPARRGRVAVAGQPHPHRRRHRPRGRPRPPGRPRLGLARGRHAAARRVDGHGDHRADTDGSRVTLTHEGLPTQEQVAATPRAGATTSGDSSCSPSRGTPAATSGPGRRSTSTRSSRGTPCSPRSSRCSAASPPRTSPG